MNVANAHSLPNARPESAIHASALTVRYDRTLALDGVTLSIPRATLAGIVGPNGAGKSTFIKASLGLVKSSGDITLLGHRYRPGDRRIVYVPQRRSIDWDFPVTVHDVVQQGRYGHLGLFRRLSSEDREQINTAMERTGVTGFAKRQIGELSGGQQQRVFLARALAQGGELLLLDEPFAGIDAATEEELLRLLRELRDEGRSIVVVHHDLGTVHRAFDHLVLLNQRVIASGPTPTVFTRKNLQATYGDRLAIVDGAALSDG